MNMDERKENRSYKVVINIEAQYSIWPAARENPLGWKDLGKIGTKSECLAFINEAWIDMRPLRLKQWMENRPP